MQNKRFPIRRILVAAAFVVSGIVTCAAIFYFHGNSEPSKLVASTEQDPVMVALAPIIKPVIPIPKEDVVEIDTRAPTGLETTSDQRLVINRALRDVSDYFLVTDKSRAGGDKFDRLLAYLKAKLPAPAYTEASEIAAHYAQYLATQENVQDHKRHGVRAMPTRLPTPEEKADRLMARIMETSRLRQQLLGVQVAKIWFGDEEAQALQYAERMRAPRSFTASSSNVDGTSVRISSSATQ